MRIVYHKKIPTCTVAAALAYYVINRTSNIKNFNALFKTNYCTLIRGGAFMLTVLAVTARLTH
jgi:hypothetical protein